jgi:hypothetical protein
LKTPDELTRTASLRQTQFNNHKNRSILFSIVYDFYHLSSIIYQRSTPTSLQFKVVLFNMVSSLGSNLSETKYQNPVVSDTDSVEMATSKSSKSTSSCRRSSSCRRPSSSHFHQNHVKHYVEHNYHDHKHDPVVMPVPNLALTEDGRFPKRSGHKGGVSTPFPEKLHELLETLDQQGDGDICGWQPHGRCFIVHKPKEFVSKIMTQYVTEKEFSCDMQ